MKLSNDNIYIEAFRKYRQMGLDPLAIPHVDGHPTKAPKTQGWQIRAATGEYSESDFALPCNIGILLSGEKNLTDIDIDCLEAVGIATEVMDRLTQDTGNHPFVFGRKSKPRSHYVYFCDVSLQSEEVRDPTDNAMIVEYRCVNQDGTRGHQTVFPPSLRYDTASGETESVELEDDSNTVPVTISSKKLHHAFRMIAGTALLAKHFPEQSERHNTILALAGVLARSGVGEKKAKRIIGLAYRNSKGYNGDQSKAEADVESVYRTFRKNPETKLFGYPKLVEIIPKAVVDKAFELLHIERSDSAYHLTDAGNGRRLVDKHGPDIRYCVDTQEWYVWDGVRWRRDVVQRVRELAKGIAADIRHDAANLKPPKPTGDQKEDRKALAEYEERREAMLRWANQSENSDRVTKTLKSAESDPRITCFRADFDRDAHLLNCPNCIVDLRTGMMLPHDQKCMMSNLCPTEYDSHATHPIWEQSLGAFTKNHDDLLPFLKRLTGYTLQGSKTEEKIVMLFGPGNAGKGTFIDWLMNAFGPDYSCAMDSNSVLKQKRDSAAASGDIARLEGKRLVVVSEIEKGSRLQQSFLKQASGNDALVARGLYQSEREFRPSHQFWFQTNYRPGFDSTDSGNKRRYIEIPFDNDLKVDLGDRFDKNIKIKMRQDKGFLKAVLAWAVAGCVEWYGRGLDIPESVQTATDELFAHNDFLNSFVADCCVTHHDAKDFVKVVWNRYERWCEEQGEEPAQGRTFNRMMEERGYRRKQVSIDKRNGKGWVGIRLKTTKELEEDADKAEAAQKAAEQKKSPPEARCESGPTAVARNDDIECPDASTDSIIGTRAAKKPKCNVIYPVYGSKPLPSVYNGGVAV